MGKSKQQKEAESLDLERQRQQVDSNKWMADFSKMLSKMTQDRFVKEQAYLTENVDPLLKGYSTTGFAPGERARLRNMAEEDVAKVYNQQERSTLKGLNRMGINSNAPSGALARVKTALGQNRADTRVGALRSIDQHGADVRRGTVPLMMQRAAGFNPQGTLSGVFPGRPVGVEQAKFGPGFWGKFGNVALDLTKSAIGAINPLGAVGSSPPPPKTYPNPFSRVTGP